MSIYHRGEVSTSTNWFYIQLTRGLRKSKKDSNSSEDTRISSDPNAFEDTRISSDPNPIEDTRVSSVEASENKIQSLSASVLDESGKVTCYTRHHSQQCADYLKI